MFDKCDDFGRGRRRVRVRCRITGNNTNRHFSLQYIIIQDRRLLNAEVFYQCSYYYALTFVEFHSLGKTFVGQNQNKKKGHQKNTGHTKLTDCTQLRRFTKTLFYMILTGVVYTHSNTC